MGRPKKKTRGRPRKQAAPVPPPVPSRDAVLEYLRGAITDAEERVENAERERDALGEALETLEAIE